MPTPFTMAGRPNCCAGAVAAKTSASANPATQLTLLPLLRIGTSWRLLGRGRRRRRHRRLSSSQDVVQIIMMRQSLFGQHVDGAIHRDAHDALLLIDQGVG